MPGVDKVNVPFGVAGMGCALILALAGARPAMAQQPSPEVVAGMKACLAVHKKRERLRCFETLAQETIARAEAAKGLAGRSPEQENRPAPAVPAERRAAPAAPAPAISTASRTEGAQAERTPAEGSQATQSRAERARPADEAQVRADYGLKRKKARKEPKKLAVVITAAWPDRRGRWHFETADGQVWRQKDDVRVRLTKLPVDARLEKGMFGGYFLDIKGVPSDIRVERLR